MSFPTTGVLDPFPYAVGGLNGQGNWAGPVGGFGTNLRVGDNASQTINGTAGSAGADYLTTVYGPDMEAFIDIVTPDAGAAIARLWVRTQNPASATLRNGYDVNIVGSTWTLGATVNNTRTVIATYTQAVAATDKFGIQVVGTTVGAWFYNHSTSLWSQLGTVTDSTVTGTGNIAVEIQNAVWTLDNLGGGTYVAPSSGAAARTLVGVGA